MKKGSLLDFKGFGVAGNLANPTDVLKIILAGVVMFFAAIMSQNVVKWVGKKTKVIDTTFENPVSPTVSTRTEAYDIA